MVLNRHVLRSAVALATTLIVSAASVAAAQDCALPSQGWHLLELLPADGDEAAPINGVITARVVFVDAAGESSWPEPGIIERSVSVRLSRDGDEVVEGELVADPAAGELRFVAGRPLAEGITYTFRIDLDNASLEPEREFVDEVGEVVFTTGANFDEAPPAFSGLQDVRMTQHAVAVEDCCEATQAYCETQCGSPCDWCWPVDFAYAPAAELTFRSLDDEFGPQTVSYVVYRLDDEFAEAGEPLEVLRFGEAGAQTHRLLLTRGDEGPYCFVVQAHDAFGRKDANDSVVCRSIEDIVPIEAQEVPEPDRSLCAEGEGPDAGMDAGSVDDAGGSEDVGDEDGGAGVVPDLPDENEEEAPQIVSAPVGDGDGCGCQTPAKPTGEMPWALLMAMVGVLVIGRRGRD